MIERYWTRNGIVDIKGTRKILHKQVTESTNDDARALIEEPWSLVYADQQTRGRGTQGRIWDGGTPPDATVGGDVFASMVVHRNASQSSLQLVSLAAGLAIVKACHNVFSIYGRIGDIKAKPPTLRIKWPNDVYIERDVGQGGGRKCAGVLIEGVTQGAQSKLVVGFGINVNRVEFPRELQNIATSLRLEIEQLSALGPHTDEEGRRTLLWSQGHLAWHIPPHSVLADSCNWLETLLTETTESRLAEMVSEHLLWQNESVSVGEHQGILRGLTADGALVLESGGKLTHHVTGELTRL